MKKILIALETGEGEKAAFRRAAGEECELIFTTPAEATAGQIREANFILGNVPPGMIAASENLDVLPFSEKVKSNGVVVIETEPSQTEDVRFTLEVNKKAKKPFYLTTLDAFSVSSNEEASNTYTLSYI